MFLSRLILNPHRQDVRRDLSNAYELHRTLLRGYPYSLNREQHSALLFRLETGPDRPMVLVQTAQVPDWSLLPAEYTSDVQGPKSLKGITFKRGQWLGFRLHANPTKRLAGQGKLSNGQPNETRWAGKRVGLLREVEQTDWLYRKAEQGGFRLHSIRLIPGGRQHLHKKDEAICLVAVTYEGILEVSEVDRFQKSWVYGIGSGKALGFGLLSLAPAVR